MVNPQKVEGLLEKLREYLSQLNELKSLKKEDFFGRFTNVNSAKYLFQVAIECCLDIGNHIISSEGWLPPADYKDIFVILNKNKIIPDSFVDIAISMAKFRNRLVHLYWEVDKDKVYDYLQNNLHYFDDYVKYAVAFLKKSA